MSARMSVGVGDFVLPVVVSWRCVRSQARLFDQQEGPLSAAAACHKVVLLLNNGIPKAGHMQMQEDKLRAGFGGRLQTVMHVNLR